MKGVAKLRGAARAMDLRKIHRLSSDLQEGQGNLEGAWRFRGLGVQLVGGNAVAESQKIAKSGQEL